MDQPTDRDHLDHHARLLFPRCVISVCYGEIETIYIDIDDTRFTFEIGSDDDEYLFVAGDRSFVIPMMDFDEDGECNNPSPLPAIANVSE